MQKRMILGIAAGVLAGATVVGVPVAAIASDPGGPGSGVQQMQQWMNDPEHVQQMQQWMNDPEHLQQMGSMMEGTGAGPRAGMHRFGSGGADATP